MRGAHVLTDVAMGFVADSQTNYTEQELSELRSAFLQMITKRITRDHAKKVILSICRSEDPFTRISDILDTEFQPPLPKPDEQEQNMVRKKTRTWNFNEDNRLYMGVCLYGSDNWNEVAPFVGNGRLRSQCSQRWLRVLDPKISKLAWTIEEDSILLQYVKIFGEKNWMKVANQMGTRSDVQCRYRYQQLQKELSSCTNGNQWIIGKEQRLESNQNNTSMTPQQENVGQQEVAIHLTEQTPSLSNSFGFFQPNSLFDATIW
ncbi:Myb-like DNA-binding domain containing protein [Histomonas meleagridis]|uniref:Myb-like DNA-binding domain containing protein n=1 Tax=Histomonas meleagridis TaxID=135588 RepID=UPI0035599AC0|nr:Myb-like DNA-binding domain containing protein [Histomonas meleagridis]KAH0804094.1 Myb-like DNA-binding domain containing protein [Histomonas meleagridis]